MEPLSFIEVKPSIIRKKFEADGNKAFFINNEMAKSGGIFAIVVDWCHYCRELKKNIYEAQMTISPFPFFYINATKAKNDIELNEKMKDMDVEYFPKVYTIEFGGKLNEYDGDRTPMALSHMARPSH